MEVQDATEEERCTRCNAKRVIQYLPEMILESGPKSVSKNYPAILDN